MTVDQAPQHNGPLLAFVGCPGCNGRDASLALRLHGTNLVTCRACGLSFVNPRASGAQLARKLQAWAEQDVVDETRLRIAFDAGTLDYYRRLLARVEKAHLAPGRRLLDIGCSTGGLLTVARSAGWDASGIDVGAASARYAREHLGLDVHCQTLYEFNGSPESYDAISMVEVIEHLEQPAAALAVAHRLLRRGGALLVTTPNVDSLYRRLFGARWWVINCEDEHIVLFNPGTLSSMIERCGFKVASVHVQGIDLVGLAREGVRLLRGGNAPEPRQQTAVGAYYEGRAARAQVKRVLERAGILAAARRGLRALDATYAWRWSPTYALGEQIVIVARRH